MGERVRWGWGGGRGELRWGKGIVRWGWGERVRWDGGIGKG